VWPHAHHFDRAAGAQHRLEPCAGVYMSVHEDSLRQSMEPLFHLLLGLQHARQPGTDANQWYRKCCDEIEQHKARCAQLELAAADATDARYAVVALIDETVMRHEGPLREHWSTRPLQTQFFEENLAGERFFERLAALRSDVKRRAVLRIYYLCLLLGFRGKYHARGSELELLEIEDSVRSELQKARAIPTELQLSPNGRRPYERLVDTRRNQLLLTLAASSSCVAVLAYFAMRLSLSHQTEQLITCIAALLGK
jgi:type VI secretion system protein ImpK